MGEPTLDNVLLLHQQVKRNTQSVPTIIGGGKLGYLALVLPVDKYNAIPSCTPFVQPTDPGTFTLRVPQSIMPASVTSLTAAVNCALQSTAGSSPSTDLVAQDTSSVIISAAEVATQKAAHKEAIKRYCECQAAVEQALRTQII